jgi:flagellin
MLSILNNVAATSAQNQMEITNTNMQKTLEQLSSGQRINSGADDAAGLSIADGLNANVAALNQSSQNATSGVGLLQVADGALAQVTSLLNRAVTLATEAANSGLTTDQHTALNNEFTSIKTEIDNIGQTTTYNGSAIFGGGAGAGAQVQATNPNTLVSSAIDTTAAAANADTAAGKLVVDVGGKTFTFTPTAGETVGNFVNDVNTQSLANGDGIQASVNATGSLVLADTATRGDIAIDKTSTFQANALTPTFANEGLNNTNVAEGTSGVSANTVVNPLTTGGTAITNAFSAFTGGVTATDATGVLEMAAQPVAASTVKVGGVTYTFQTAAITAAGEVQIGGNEKASLQNLANAVNGSDSYNTANALISAGSATDVVAGVNTDATLTLTANTAGTAAGTAAGAGNALGGTSGATWNAAWNTGATAAVNGHAAAATFTLSTQNLAVGSTLDIGSTNYQFVANGTSTAGHTTTGATVWVALGTNVANTISATISAINGSGDGSVVASANVAVPANPEALVLTTAATTAAADTTTGSGVLTSAVVAGTTENLIVTTDNTPQSFQVAAGATVADVINTINNAGTGITAALDTSTGKLMLTDTQDNGDIAVTDNASNQLVNNLSGETLGGTTNGFGTPELMTSTNTMSVFLSDSTQTGTSTVNVALNTFNSTNLGVAGQGIANNDLTNTTDAATALTAINTAISNVSALRGNLGSGVNQLQAATNVISSQTQNLTTASSNITSADIGQTVANMTEFSILSQTGMAAMAQADQMQKGILTLLQG